MKRRIFIEVNIDTDSQDKTCMFRDVLRDCYKIKITQEMKHFDGPIEQTIPIIVTHELGHVIGEVFNLPGSANDPRPMGPGLMCHPKPNAGMKILESEQEAWNISDLMIRAAVARKTGLDSYRSRIDFYDHVFKPEEKA